jgi:hypothetical protein
MIDKDVLFPALRGKTCCAVNLDAEAAAWLGRNAERFAGQTRNPLLEPAICQEMLDEFHQRLGVDWSFGGYLEDRRRVWHDSYLDRAGNYLHLGVDFNVPQHTAIAAGFACQVMLVDEDDDTDGGWGTRVFMKPDPSLGWDVVFIYAHVQNVRVGPGDALQPGATFAEVGGPPHNGNWHPHLHIQALRNDYFRELLIERFHELDGYGHPNEVSNLRLWFPNPLSGDRNPTPGG